MSGNIIIGSGVIVSFALTWVGADFHLLHYMLGQATIGLALFIDNRR